MGRMILIDSWETENMKFVILGDTKTNGKSLAELIYTPKKKKKIL